MKTIRFEVRGWPGHLPGQHADVRLTAPDGYRAERSYSIASPPEDQALELTVDRLEDGEVSPFLTDHLGPGDTIELRGPIGGHFVWRASAATRPLVLVAGGTGVVPLMCMLRHRHLARHDVATRLLYSTRTHDELIYGDELRALAMADSAFLMRIALTRSHPAGWTGLRGRIDLPAVLTTLEGITGSADCYVCGSDGFVEAAASLLVRAGQPPAAIRTERFGAARG